MKNKLLFPFAFKIIGIVLLPVFAVLVYLWTNDQLSIAALQHPVTNSASLSSDDGNYTNELVLGGLLFSMILIAFSREKIEDERTTLIRLQSLHLTHYLNYIILALWILTTNGLGFLLAAVELPYVFLAIFLLIYNTRLYIIPRFQHNIKSGGLL